MKLTMQTRTTQLNRAAALVAVAVAMSLSTAADGPACLSIVCQRGTTVPATSRTDRQVLAHWLSRLTDAAGVFSVCRGGGDRFLAVAIVHRGVSMPVAELRGGPAAVEPPRVHPPAPLRPHLTDMPPPDRPVASSGAPRAAYRSAGQLAV